MGLSMYEPVLNAGWDIIFAAAPFIVILAFGIFHPGATLAEPRVGAGHLTRELRGRRPRRTFSERSGWATVGEASPQKD
jgi:hypothetical protein